MFRASSAYLREDTVVYMQHMVLSLSMRVPGGLSVHSLSENWGRLLVGVLRHPPTTFPLQSVLTQAVYRQATRNSHREWQYHMLPVYNCILLKMSTWGSKHVETYVLRHPPTTFFLQSVLTQAVYRQATRNSHRECQYHMLHIYKCILLNMSTWDSKHVEENSILWINNNEWLWLKFTQFLL